MNRKQISIIIGIILLFSFLVGLTGCSNKKDNNEKNKISTFNIAEKDNESQNIDKSKSIDNEIENVQPIIEQKIIGGVSLENDNEITNVEKEKNIEEKNESSNDVLKEGVGSRSLQPNNSISKETTVKESTSKENTATNSAVKENEGVKEVNSIEKNEKKETYSYVLNNNTKRFHYSNCSSVKQIKKENYGEYTGTREDLMAKGYIPCKKCNP